MRIASLNVGTMRGRSNKVVETTSRRGIDLCCIQKCRWRVASAKMIDGKYSTYKCFYIGNKLGTEGVALLLAEKCVDKEFNVKRT